MNEKRQKAINEMNWRMLKKEFDEIKTYPEKLKWWEIKIPSSKLSNLGLRESILLKTKLFYDTDGSPLIENPFPVKMYGKTEVTLLDKIPEYISILPDINNLTEKELFWNWLLKINEIETLSELESDFLVKFSKSNKINHTIMTDGFKNDINYEFECGKLASDEFLNGRTFAIHNDFAILFNNCTNWNISPIEENRILQELYYTIEGYQNRLKEMALDKVIKSLKDKTNQIEPIEDIPTEIQQKICWLYAIGVIDSIKEKNKIYSNSTIGRILSKGLGFKPNTIKQTLDRIEKESLLDKFDSYINNTCSTLKIDRIH